MTQPASTGDRYAHRQQLPSRNGRTGGVTLQRPRLPRVWCTDQVMALPDISYGVAQTLFPYTYLVTRRPKPADSS